VFSKGSDDATVTIVEFTDFECPFCERYYTDTYGQIISDYVDTGKVKYIYRDLPLPFHANAENAAVAVRCAAREGKFEEMHNMIFENQSSWAEEADANKTFVSYGTKLGIAAGTMQSCMSDESVLTEVQADNQLASTLGANGTPTFIVNGTLLVGAQPYAAFQAAIEAEL